MKVIVTEVAKQFLLKLMNKHESLLLLYDTSGCGCAVNGVPAILIVHEVESNLHKIETNGIPLFIKKEHLIFFEDEMKIDCLNQKLKLSSSSQIYTNHLRINRLS